jgi:acyl-CoA synthetase (NDP forming)
VPRTANGVERLFLPESVAIVGASETPGRVGRLTFAAIKDRFVGSVLPVNPRRSEVLGVPAYASVSALPAVPDLAVLAVSASDVLPVARECVDAGVGGLVVFGSGFAETGGEGAGRQAELAALIDGSRTRLLGPNSLGFFDASRGLLASFLFADSTPPPMPGPLALISQSGGFAEQLLARSEDAGIGLGWMISIGNELDLNVASCLEFLLTQDTAEIIAVFAESIKDAPRFIAAGERARELGRPIVIIKTGRSVAGARAAVTHTASMAGSDRVFQQVCDDLGIARVDTLDDVVDVARVLTTRRRLHGPRLGIVTASGGGGVLAADLADDAGLTVPLLSERLQAEVRRYIPGFGTGANPIDVTAQGADSGDAFQRVLEGVAGSGEVDTVLCVFSSHGRVAIDVAETISRVYGETSIPFAAVWGSPEPASLDVLQRVRLPVFRNPRNAVKALAAAARVHAPTEAADGEPARAAVHDRERCPICTRATATRLVLEAEAHAFLAGYGVTHAASRATNTVSEAVAAAGDLGFPVVLKLVADHLPHREKAGAISFNVSTPRAVAEEYDRLRALLPAGADGYVLVQQQLPRGDEVMVGASRDAAWGATVLVGIGGSHAELINRTALRLTPVSFAAAASAVRDVFAGHLDLATVDAVARVAQGVSLAMGDHPEIASIDINPLIVTPAGPVAVDALVAVGAPVAP